MGRCVQYVPYLGVHRHVLALVDLHRYQTCLQNVKANLLVTSFTQGLVGRPDREHRRKEEPQLLLGHGLEIHGVVMRLHVEADTSLEGPTKLMEGTSRGTQSSSNPIGVHHSRAGRHRQASLKVRGYEGPGMRWK